MSRDGRAEVPLKGWQDRFFDLAFSTPGIIVGLVLAVVVGQSRRRLLVVITWYLALLTIIYGLFRAISKVETMRNERREWKAKADLWDQLQANGPSMSYLCDSLDKFSGAIMAEQSIAKVVSEEFCNGKTHVVDEYDLDDEDLVIRTHIPSPEGLPRHTFAGLSFDILDFPAGTRVIGRAVLDPALSREYLVLRVSTHQMQEQMVQAILAVRGSVKVFRHQIRLGSESHARMISDENAHVVIKQIAGIINILREDMSHGTVAGTHSDDH